MKSNRISAIERECVPVSHVTMTRLYVVFLPEFVFGLFKRIDYTSELAYKWNWQNNWSHWVIRILLLSIVKFENGNIGILAELCDCGTLPWILHDVIHFVCLLLLYSNLMLSFSFIRFKLLDCSIDQLINWSNEQIEQHSISKFDTPNST